MTEKNKQERQRKLAERMEKKRGYMPPSWSYMVENDVEFIEAYNNLYEKAFSDGEALPAKVREFIAIGILAFRGERNGVYLHAKRALKLGATKRELLEAIETAFIPGGAPAFGAGLDALMRIDKENEESKGKKT
jgi:alkylhydroperoxidase/carboxymuconolactone decarboxylase family protein YurZ